MKLTEVATWQHEILDGDPIRLEPESITPPTNAVLTFVGIEHGNESQPDYLRDVLADTDIFFPEVNAWDPFTAKMLQKVSNGDYKARQKVLQNSASNFMGFAEGMCRALYNSKVKVLMADLPHTSPIPEKLSRVGYDSEGMLTSAAFPLMVERDKNIARVICSGIAKAKEENPRLRDKDVRATAVFGVGHISVEAALKAAARMRANDTFSTLLFFDEAAAANRSQDMIDYNNWLRTTGEET